MVDPNRRVLPARDNLRRIHGDWANEIDIAGVDMVLHLLNTVDILRSEIYVPLMKTERLSEGKFTLMMVLRDIGRPISTMRLAHFLGVTGATVSVMVTRMLEEPVPLIQRIPSPHDGRSVLVGLTQQGDMLLDRVIPEHFKRVSRMVRSLNEEERETLINLLQKMLGPEFMPPVFDSSKVRW